MESDPVSGQINNSTKNGIKIQQPSSQGTASVTSQPCLPSVPLLLFFLTCQNTFIKQLHVTWLSSPNVG